MVRLHFASDATRYRESLHRLLRESDEAFVPALTAPERADVARLDGGEGSRRIEEYVQWCLERPLLVATPPEPTDTTELVGFVSIDPVEADDEGPLAAYTPTNHVDIIVVAESARGEGVGRAMYEYLLEHPPEDRPYVSTKTWSTNDAHLHLLRSLGFENVRTVPEDRAPGVDTVYYARHV